MADGGATFYIAMAAMAAGTAVTTMDTINANKRRQMILEQELRSNELAALDEENQRLIQLRHANEDMLANAGGVDAWASPSLIAARAFNFQMGMEDIENIRFNVSSARAGISAKIAILKSNSRATAAAGIFEVAGIVAGGLDAKSKLGKTSTKIPTGGGGGINATHGTGILDVPGFTPGTING
jgi:hypothetical protein